MIGFFRDVVEAVCEKGVRGLLEEVPGGRFFCDVAERVVDKRRARLSRAELRAEFAEIIVLTHEAAREEARAAFAAVARETGKAIPPAEVEAAAEWVAGIPESLRLSNRRADDPAGRSLSLDFALDTPDDVLKVLPPRPPRFLAGQPVPGREEEWTLRKLLGVGGFGEVWLATHDDGYHDPMAVKFFFDQTGRDVIREAELVKRAMDAGRGTAASADDPRRHIVPILQVRLKGDAPWLGFEYVAGGDLAASMFQLARADPERRVSQVVAALGQLCRGVGVFHGLPTPLVHRDLKPSNILIDPATQALRITDFGIGAVTQRATNAREARGESTRGGRLQSYLRGSHTPTYSSPEQRAGADPDPRDDVHALGVIGYQLLVGDMGSAPGADLADDLRDAGAPPALIEVLAACVARKRERRPADARDLAARLAALGAKPAAKPASPPPPPAGAMVVCARGTGTHRTIGDALQAAKPGAEVRVRPGVYREAVVLDKDVTLASDGPVADVVVESAHAPCLEVKTARATVRGLTFRGIAGTAGKKFAAVSVGQGAPELTDCDISSDSLSGLCVFGTTAAPVVTHCRVHDCAEGGFYLYQSAKGTFVGCEAAENRLAGFYVQSGGDPTVRDSTFRDSREGGGIMVYENGRGTFEGCESWGNKYSGFEVKSGGDPTVRGCTFRDSREGAGVFVWEGGRGTFERCESWGNKHSGFEVKSEGDPTVRNCTFRDSRESCGIFVWEKGRGTFERCEVWGNRHSGFEVKSGGAPTVRRCTFRDSRESCGVMVWENGRGMFEGCEASGNKYSGFLVKTGGDPAVRDFRAHANETGFQVWENGRGTFEGCEAWGNKFSGFEAKSGGTPTVRRCTFRNSREGCGVLIWENGKGTFEGCKVTGNALTGVEVREGSDPVFRDCKINDGQGYGVYVHTNGRGTFDRCNVRGNAKGPWWVAAGCTVRREGNTES